MVWSEKIPPTISLKIFVKVVASKHKKVCHDFDRSHHFTSNYVMEVIEATVFFYVKRITLRMRYDV